MNPRTAWLFEEDIVQLKKIPLNKDYSQREHFPYLKETKDSWLVVSFDGYHVPTIAKCSNVKEAINIVMLLRLQVLDIEKCSKRLLKGIK